MINLWVMLHRRLQVWHFGDGLRVVGFIDGGLKLNLTKNDHRKWVWCAAQGGGSFRVRFSGPSVHRLATDGDDVSAKCIQELWAD